MLKEFSKNMFFLEYSRLGKINFRLVRESLIKIRITNYGTSG